MTFYQLKPDLYVNLDQIKQIRTSNPWKDHTGTLAGELLFSEEERLALTRPELDALLAALISK